MEVLKIKNRSNDRMIYAERREDVYKELKRKFGKPKAEYFNNKGQLVAGHWIVKDGATLAPHNLRS